jgi:MFS family permease
MRWKALTGLSPMVWLLGTASLLNDVSSEAIFPLLPLFVTSLGGGAAVLGVIEGAADALAAAVKVVAGHVSDRGPRRLLVVGGYTLPAFARAGIAAALAPWHVLGARLADRLGKGVRSGPRDALLADAAPAGETGRAFGLQRSMDHLGAALGPLLAAGLVAAGAPLRAVFAVAAAVGLAAPLLLALRLRDARSGAPAVAAAGPGAPPPAARHLPADLRGYVALAGLFALANSTDAFLLLRARDAGVPDAGIPLLWFLHHVVKTLAGLPGGALSDRVPRGAVVAAGWGAYALAYAGFALARTPLQIAALFAFYAAYHGLAEGAERALVADLAPAGLRGRAFGWYHGVAGAVALPAGLVTGALWDRRGAAVALGACAAVAALAALLLAVSPLARRRPGRRVAAFPHGERHAPVGTPKAP